MNQLNNDFFKDVDTISHNINLCMDLTFDDQSNISRIDLYKKDLLYSSFDKTDLTPILDFISFNNLSVSGSAKSNFLSFAPIFLQELEEKHKTLTLPHSSVKLILILDAKDLLIKHWSSLPVLNNDGQVQEYFQNIIRFGSMALESAEMEHLEEYVTKISDKMLGKN